MTTLHGRTAIVTGANTGIGLETAAALAAQGAHVVLTSRDPGKGAVAVTEVRRRHPGADVDVMLVDFNVLNDVRAFAKAFEASHDRLDILVNNAGAVQGERSVTPDGFETTFQVNHLAPFLLTNLLLPLIKRSAPSRIINLASSAHRGARIDFDDLQSEGVYIGLRVYGKSKLCNILFTRELARRLEGTGVSVNAVHPGVVRTGFGQDGDARGFFKWGLAVIRPFVRTPATGAKTSIHVATAPEGAETSGEYWANRRVYRSSKASKDMETARRLWEVSEQLTGLNA